ncbi:hypothetical protein [Flavilitoribacter nigricans]|uniref:Uncharacterized protein n=1 Tax=Flavilitoribacter nigricans (strain ATCC 23147 / DSM 23189 / NBRC 102662 / NCIMB 1420 / SS-2) TaxID=1122177 RepID=A0A2D0N9N6_FLAN2|nr:hypothetical protein [Flavilitoribacter nigricans]PHN04493.1 hypothetical protein CRP01_21025 [Flavilitoribacter nigricans DSM 23189 = NBRC 102662]
MSLNKYLLLILLAGMSLPGCSPAAYEDISTPTGGNDREHPFLIVKKEQFPALRQRAAAEPWTSIKADALRRSDAGFTWRNNNSQNAYGLQDYIGAAALAYILDESRTSLHAGRVRDAILEHYARLDLSEDRDWGGVVPNLGSFFVAILSLDIVYDALTPEEVLACEKVITDQIFILKREGSWADVRRGTHGAWDIYRGDRTEPDDAYYAGIMQQVTEDGVSPVTIHYAWERVGGGDSRISKSGYMDVLEFTGIDRRYYQNERLQKFHRWLFGSSVNAAKEMAIIGDMLPTQSLHNDMLHRRAGNFDEEAAAYAAWFHEGRPAQGNILTYIIPQNALPAPKVPESQWYPNGGAFFREKPDDPDGLQGVLYNIKSQDEWHTHQETNGLALSGLGNRLLVNGGRLGAPTRPAPLNNTLTIDGKEHASRLGKGILEGFTTDQLDYACGAAGPALPGDEHLRSLLLVHAEGSVRPYFLLLDEVVSSPGEAVHSYFHPANETRIETLSEGSVYTAPIDHYPTVPGAQLGFFFATPPQRVQIEKVPGAVPERYANYPEHNRLEVIYPAERALEVPIATVLFPHRKSEALPPFERITTAKYQGGTIAHGNGTSDILLTGSGSDQQQYGEVRFRANSVLYRENNGVLNWFFLRQGRHFANGTLSLDATAPVSIFMQSNTGAITSDGAELTLKGPGVENIQFDGAVQDLERTSGVLRVQLPAGTIRMQ